MEEWLGVRISTEQKVTLEKLAADSGNRSVASVVRQFIDEGIARHYKQLPLAVADETPQENPTEQMKKNGAAPLVEA